MKYTQVRISKKVMDVLRKSAKPFENPQEVLDRLLSKNPCAVEEEKAPTEEQQDEVMQDDES